MASSRSCTTETVMRSSITSSRGGSNLLNPFAAIKRRKPLRIFAIGDGVIVGEAGGHAAMRETKVLNGNGHAAGVGVGDFDVHVHDAAVPRKAHGAEARGVAQLQQFV